MSLDGLDRELISSRKKEVKKQNDERLKTEKAAIEEELDDKSRRLLQAASEKGASAWLSCLPLARLGYVINKQEFRDAVCLRYGWQIQDAAKFCGCGKQNSLDHIITCKKGGYVVMRHNALRDAEIQLMEEICVDVRKEPTLIPTTEELTNGNTAEKARLDISAIGVWGRYEKTFFDVRVTHPNAESYMTKSLETIYKEHESEKKSQYNDRVLHNERASFTPLVFTTTGGMGHECEKLNRRIANLLARKRNAPYHKVISYVRHKLRFALLRTILYAVRGIRGKERAVYEESIEDISFNLIPDDGSEI